MRIGGDVLRVGHRRAVRVNADDLEALVKLHDAERAAERDRLSFVTAMSAFDQAVTEMSGNHTLAVIAGVFRDIYAGQVYSAIGDGDTSADQIARRVIVSHSAFLDAARRGDASLAHTTWSDYLSTTGRMLVSRNVSRRPIDVTTLWRAQANQAGAEPTPRRALIVAAEIRARIAEGRLKDGDRLAPLPELANEFGISRPTLREALRILEMEFLLDLRTGDRGGATICTPSTRIAAQMAGLVLEARKTTVADCFRTLRLIEPPIIGVIASRITVKQLDALHAMNAKLAISTEDTPQFVTAWRVAEGMVFSAAKNPALTVIAEILHWIRVGVESAVIADVKDLPWVHKTNRKVQGHFAQFVVAASERDTAGASRAWSECLKVNQALSEHSDFGARLLRDLMD